MPIPVVTCGADIVYTWNQGGGIQTAALTANATNAPISWEWRILSVPVGLAALLTGTHGNFVNGVATAQNPSLPVPTATDFGSVVIQCLATNATGQSDPTLDRQGAQQNVAVLDSLLGVAFPGDYQYDWGQTTLDLLLRAKRTLLGAHAARHVTGGDQIPTATVSARGLLPILGGGTANFLRADGAWAAAAAAVQTTKGDLAGHTTVPARVPVGTNGQVLTADSALALGLKWATPAASGGSTLLLADDTQRDEAGLTYVTHKSFRFAMDAASPWTAFRVAISLWHDTATSVEVRIAFDDPYGDAAVVTSTATAEDLQYVTIPWTGAVTKAFILGIVQLKRTDGTGNAHLKFLEIFGVK